MPRTPHDADRPTQTPPASGPRPEAEDLVFGERSGIVEHLDDLVRRFEEVRHRPAVAVIVVAVTVLAGLGWWLGRPGVARPVEDLIPYATTVGGQPAGGQSGAGVDPATTSTEATSVVVHVAGAVRRPGVVMLDAGARIGDAIEAAGGPAASADLHQLNLAAPLTDGLQIRVPVEGEVVSPVGVPAPGSPAADGASAGPVRINSASADELERLPGIGPALAAAIVEWRSDNGPFSSVDGLLAVPGIGPAKLAGLVDHAVL